jgi:cytochrome c nitrite reductase small subunit
MALNRKHLLAILLGAAAGLSAYTFIYARGFSYFSNDAKTCMNCHIMREQFDSWNRSSHRATAVCNGCHTPKNVAGKYAVKGINGFNHSLAFTTGRYPDPIQIKRFNAGIARANCYRCHEGMVDRMLMLYEPKEIDCSACHGNVGHRERL